jgi:hypothetical protein
MKKLFCFLAALGLILGLIVHIVSLSGIYIGNKFPFVWSLNIAILIVWIPALLELIRDPDLKQFRLHGNKNPIEFLKIIFKNTPKPVVILIIIFFIYMGINFFLFLNTNGGGVPEIMNGKYVIQNHGSIIKELSDIEYLKMQANEIRGFSGHWMAFNAIAMGILWPNKE